MEIRDGALHVRVDQIVRWIAATNLPAMHERGVAPAGETLRDLRVAVVRPRYAAEDRHGRMRSGALGNGQIRRDRHRSVTTRERDGSELGHGRCDRRKTRTWSIVFSSKSFGSLHGKIVDWDFGASA